MPKFVWALVAGAGVLSLALVVALAVIGRTVAARRAANNAAVSAMAAKMEALQAETREEFERTGEVTVEDGRVDRALGVMEEAAAAAQGDTAKMFKIVSEVMKDLAEGGKGYQAGLDELNALGGLDFSEAKTRDDLAKRLKAWDALGAASLELEKLSRALPATIQQRLLDAGINEAERKGFMAGFNRGGRLRMMVELRELDTELVAAARDQINLLSERFGTWEHDPADGLIAFQEDADAAKFDEAFQRFQAAADKQTKLQEQLMKIETPAARK